MKIGVLAQDGAKECGARTGQAGNEVIQIYEQLAALQRKRFMHPTQI